MWQRAEVWAGSTSLAPKQWWTDPQSKGTEISPYSLELEECHSSCAFTNIKVSKRWQYHFAALHVGQLQQEFGCCSYLVISTGELTSILAILVDHES
jgi:hypothetical protein